MAAVKNYGLSGVGSDVQLGKAGGRLKYTGGQFSTYLADGATLARFKGAVGTQSDDYVTLAQLQQMSGEGLKVHAPVSAVANATTMTGTSWAGSTTFTATPTAAQVGTFTSCPATVDGFALSIGSRVLVIDQGITYTGDTITAVGAGAERNGIYVVTTVGSGSNGVWVRATDHGGNLTTAASGAAAYDRNNDDMRYGDYVFVSAGSAYKGRAYFLSNFLNVVESDPSIEPDLNEDHDSGRVVFVTFSTAPTFVANQGIELVSNELRMDVDTLSDGTVTLGSTVPFGDGNTSTDPNFKSTLGSIFNTLNVVTVSNFSSGVNFIAQTAEDTYSKYTLAASTTAAREGAHVTINGSVVEVGVDINGLTDVGTVAGAHKIALFDGTNNRNTSLTDLLADLNVANLSANGIAVRTAAGTYAARTLTAAGTPNGGIVITNGNGVAGNPTIGIDLPSLTDIGTGNVVAGDLLLVSDTSDAANNKKLTVGDLASFVAAGISTSSIGQLNSSVTVVDAGTGTITMTVDGNATLVVTDGQVVVDSLTVSDLTAGRVLLAGAAGSVEDSANLTFSGSNLGVTGTLGVSGAATVGSLSSGGAVTGTTATFTAVDAGAGLIQTTGAVTASSMTASGTITATGGIIDSTLAVSNGVVFASGGNLNQDAGFTYDAGTDTLSVANLNVTNGLGLTATEIAYGSATGGIAHEAAFTYTAATDTLTVGNFAINGGASQTITGSVSNGNINIVPNGTGSVVLGSAGAAVLSSDTGEDLTITGAANLTLQSGTGIVTVKDNSLSVATFSANASAVSYLTITADTAANGVKLGIGGTSSDLRVVLGAGKLVLVDDEAAYLSALASNSGDALVTKAYVDSAISSGASAGSVQTRQVAIPLTSAATVNIGAVLPAGAIVLSVSLNVAVASDVATLVDIGITGSVDKYMTDAENDPQLIGNYVAHGYFLESSAAQVIATVTVPGSTGTANVVVEYRVPV